MQHVDTFSDPRAEIYKPPGRKKGANAMDGRIIKQGWVLAQ
jgi:hypothetical protein